MDRISPNTTDFLVLPISGTDLFLAYRFDGVSYKRLVVNYKELINSIVSLVGTGSNVTLQVNSVNNLVQNKLDLKNGSNISIVDNGDGSVTINSTGGGGGSGTVTSVTVNASNALSATGNPITTSGAITLGWTGTNLQFVRGDGTLSTILTALSQFTNDVGFITSAALAPYLTSAAAALTYVPLSTTIEIQGVAQDLSASRIWSFPSLPLKGGMYIEQTYFTNVGPINVLWIPTVNKVYCANHANNTITIHNATTGELTNSLPLTGAINLFHITQIGTPEILAVGTGAPTVISRINITATPGGESIIGTYTGFGTIVTANEPADYLGFSSTKAYISQIGSNSIAVVNPSTGALTSTIAAVGTNPIGLANNTNGASAMNGRVVVGVNAGLTVINETTNTVTALNVNPSSLLSTVRYVKYVSGLDMYIVASSGTQRVVFLKPASATTFTVLGSIRLNGVSDIFVDEVENICYVSHSSGQNTTNVLNLNITSIDLNTLQVLQTYYGNITGGTGNYRSKISADPASRRFFVTMLNNIVNGTFIKIKY